MTCQESKRARIAITSMVLLSIAGTIGVLFASSLPNDSKGTSGSHALKVPAPRVANAPANSDQLGDSWPMFRGALNHTGVATTNASQGTSPTWTCKTGSYLYSSPAVLGGRLYIGGYDYNIYCLNATTGLQIWSYYTGNNIISSPAIANGRVFAGSEDDKLYCLNALTGTFIWSYSTASGIESSPAVWNGRVYVGSADDYLYCLNATTGSYLWSFKTGSSIYGSSPAIAGGYAYVGSYDDKFYCLNATTGSLKWSFTTGYAVFSSPAIANGRVYVGSYDDKIYCLNAATGAFIWSYTTGGCVESSPAVMNGRVYIGSQDSKLYCLDATTGALYWTYTTGGTIYSSSPVVTNGFVYEGSNDQRLYCLDATTGAFNWSFMTSGSIFSSPAVASGHVFFGSEDDYVYCLPLKVTKFIAISNPMSTSSWYTGASYYIDWYSAGCSAYMIINLYSGGYYYSTITSSASNIGYYYWTIPSGIHSGYYQIFIQDYYNSSIHMLSNSFYINGAPGYISITTPTSSSSWLSGSTYAIAWTSTGCSSYVTIQLYSSGSYYSTITSSASNGASSSYWWSIPSSIPSGYYQIYIRDYYNSESHAYSDSFYITGLSSSITISNPSASSSWSVGSSYYISWSSSGCSSYVTIQLYSGGSLYTTIGTGISNSGNYYWFIPSSIPTGYYQVCISDYYNSGIYAYSSSFYIGSSGSISISSPSASSSWSAGNSYYIDWSSSGCSSYVTIRLYSGSSFYTTIASSTSNSGYLYWTIPSSIPSGYYQVEIKDFYNSASSTQSNSFYISTARSTTTSVDPGTTSAVLLIVLGVSMSILIPTAAHRIRMKKPAVPPISPASSSSSQRNPSQPRNSPSPRNQQVPVSDILPRSAFVQQLVQSPPHPNIVPRQPMINATPNPVAAPPETGIHPGTPKWERLARFDISQYTASSDAPDSGTQVADGNVHDGIRIIQGGAKVGMMPAEATEIEHATEPPSPEVVQVEDIDAMESGDITNMEAPPVAEQIANLPGPEMAVLAVKQADLEKESPGQRPSAIVLTCPDCGTRVQAVTMNENLTYHCKKCKKAMEMEISCPSCFGKVTVGQDDFDASGKRASRCPVCFEPLGP